MGVMARPVGGRVALGLGLVLAGCGDDATGVGGEPDARVGVGVPDGGAPGKPTFRDCRGRAYEPLPDQDWDNWGTEATVALGAANHSAQDLIAVPGAPPTLPGKFTYGTVSKDLEDERVNVVIDDCQGWRELGEFTTDSDGRIGAPVGMTFDVGVYEARFQVLGDQSLTRSYLWVLPVGTRLVVSDIDGTLTASDSELFQQVLDGSHVPEPYPAAVELTTAHAGIGHVILYMTGRPYWLSGKTRGWLEDLAFAAGPLHLTDSNEEALPTEAGVGDYKLAYLASLVAAGYSLELAYGNATTDIYAYLGAMIPPEKVWIIGDNAGQQGTNAVVTGWTERVAEVQALPPVEQPFDW